MLGRSVSRLLQRLKAPALKGVAGQAGVFALKVCGAGLAIVLNVAITRSVSLPEAGAFFLALSITTIVYALARLGFGYTTARFVAHYHALKDTARLLGSIRVSLEVVAVSSLTIGLVILAASEIAGRQIFEDEHVARIMPIFAITIPVFCVGSIFAEVMKGIHRSLAFSFLDSIAPRIIAIPAVILLVDLVGGVGIGWGYFVGVSATFVISVIVVVRSLPSGWRQVKPIIERGKLYSSASYFFIVSIASVFGQAVTPIVVGYLISPSASALYYTAYRTAAVVEFVFISSAAVLGPRFVAVIAGHSKAALFVESKRAAFVMLAAAALIAMPLILLAPYVMQLYGDGFKEAVPVLRILATGQLLAAPLGVFLFTLIALESQRLLSILSVSSTLLGVVLIVIMTERLGLEGAAMGQAAFMVLQAGSYAGAALFIRGR